MKKKNRGFTRRLKRELQLREALVENLEKMLDWKEQEIISLSNDLTLLSGRVIEVSEEFIVPPYERDAQAKIRHRMILNVLDKDMLNRVVGLEIDTSFVGYGTKYKATVQMLDARPIKPYKRNMI